jgi:hypothetical protein
MRKPRRRLWRRPRRSLVPTENPNSRPSSHRRQPRRRRARRLPLQPRPGQHRRLPPRIPRRHRLLPRRHRRIQQRPPHRHHHMLHRRLPPRQRLHPMRQSPRLDLPCSRRRGSESGKDWRPQASRPQAEARLPHPRRARDRPRPIRPRMQLRVLLQPHRIPLQPRQGADRPHYLPAPLRWCAMRRQPLPHRCRPHLRRPRP